MEKWMNRPAWVEIDLRKFDSNVKLIKSRIAPGAQMLAVVKADCYGHNMRECYKVLKENDIHNFGIASISEGIELPTAWCCLRWCRRSSSRPSATTTS